MGARKQTFGWSLHEHYVYVSIVFVTELDFVYTQQSQSAVFIMRHACRLRVNYSILICAKIWKPLYVPSEASSTKVSKQTLNIVGKKKPHSIHLRFTSNRNGINTGTTATAHLQTTYIK